MVHRNESPSVLRADGVCFVLDTSSRVPRVLHWGADLAVPDDDADGAAVGPPGAAARARSEAIESRIEDLLATADPAVLNNSPDVPRIFTTWPSEADGWSGTPAQRGHAAGRATTPRLGTRSVDTVTDPLGGGSVVVHYTDEVTRLDIRQTFAMDRFGILSVSSELTLAADAPAPYTLDGVLALLPVPERARESLDFGGKWVRERAPQRRELAFGTHRRLTRRGKPGHDSPYLLALGEPGFGYRSGEVWAVHLAWSGEAEYLAEKLPESPGVHSAVLGAGEALHPGEIILAPGEGYSAPEALFAYSDAGLDALSARFHSRLRARTSHPRSPRPLVLNTWEAVYFEHDMDRLGPLIEAAAAAGVERMVLDDGWFRGRRADDAGLGDWSVDRGVWPQGLHPFVEAVRAKGMQFGLWFEPEMVNLDSELARAHPEWILGPSAGLGPSSRNQYVLDISRPDAYEHVLGEVDALVLEYGIDFIKWDHNRDLLEAVTRSPGGERPAVHAQTLALYRMLDELKARHPGLEIETCSGGGGRVDLGILEHTDRLWPSDCNDPVERLRIERATRLLVPPELIGSHLGDETSHTTGRRTDLSFRLAAALFSHAGIEMDLTRVSPEVRDIVARWAGIYTSWRGVLHTGRVVNAELADDDAMLQGVIAADGSCALFAWIRLATAPEGQAGRVRFPGLDPRARYRVRVREDLGASRRHGGDPAWLARAVGGPVELSGAVLGGTGVPLPTLNPQQAMLIELERTS